MNETPLMDNHSPQRQYPFNLDLVIRRGLGRTLLVCFFGFAVLPMTLVGFISYQTAYQRLEQEIHKNIRLTTEMKGLQLQVWFDRLADADRQRLESAAVYLLNKPANGHAAPEAAGAGLVDSLNQILKEPMALGTSSRAYLLDADLNLIAGTIGVPIPDGSATLDTLPARLWQEKLTSGGFASPPPLVTYTGMNGNPVMGTCLEVRLSNNIRYALIVEIETRAAFETVDWLRTMIVSMVILSGVVALVVATALARSIVRPIHDLSQGTLMVTAGRFDHDMHVTVNNEIGELAAAVKGMVDHLKVVQAQNNTQSRSISGLSGLHRLIDGEREVGELYLNTLEFLADFLDLCQANFYIVNGHKGLHCASRFPGQPDDENQQVYYSGNGRVGQAALGKAMTFFRKETLSGLVTPVPVADQANLIAVPLMLQKTVKGVLELEKTGQFSQFDCRFVEAAAEVVAVAVDAALIRQQEAVLLKRTQEQAKKLKGREAALAASNRDLQTQCLAFQTTEKKLQLKQLETEAANAQMVKNAADLEAHMAILKTQKRDMQRQNTELEKTHRELEEKARQLEISSRYKTEFMANMSHELRTPLNSILLLSRLLQENKEKTLTAKQSEFAETIHSAGEDLLNLINEILDLAKVESGKMEVDPAPLGVRSIAEAMQVSFAPVAEQNGVAFIIQVAPDAPRRLMSDRKRIEQIVKNFLSNAFKFTAKGTILLDIAVSRKTVVCPDVGDGKANGCLAISVADTGIGIPPAKHRMVFEAFQQVDGSTRRKYGGTGLGLSISRELARLLGGTIALESESGRGSRFTLYLPIIPLPDTAALMKPDPLFSPPPSTAMVEPPSPADKADVSRKTNAFKEMDPPPAAIQKNQNSPLIQALDNIQPNRRQAMDTHQPILKGRNVLLVDDDMRTVFAVSNVLEDLGVKVVAGKTGKESLDKLDGFPDIDLVIMDVMVSDVDGYRAIREIRNRRRYQTLPIIALTAKAMQGDRAKCIEAGADDYLAKPVNTDKLTSMLEIWLEPQLSALEHSGIQSPH